MRWWGPREKRQLWLALFMGALLEPEKKRKQPYNSTLFSMTPLVNKQMVNVSRNGRKKNKNYLPMFQTSRLPANVSDFTKYSESRVGSWSHILRGLLKEDEWIPRKQQYNLSFSFASNLQSQTDYVSPWRQTSSDILKSSLKKEIIFSCW